ncbi:hypothetical protein [Deinococcus rubellus]
MATELALPVSVGPEEVAQTFRQLIVTLHPLVSRIMLAVQDEASP